MAVLVFQGGLFDADSMLAAGGGYTGATLQRKGICPMTMFGECRDCESLDQGSLGRGSHWPLWRAQAFVWVRLISFNCGAGDLRWTMVALGLRWLGAVGAFGQRQLALWARNVQYRAWQGARFAAHRRDADSMVAAGGR